MENQTTCTYQSTTDYDQFKMLNSNREVDDNHVRKLIEQIVQKNLLHLNPIVVNCEMEVIDGQHRLAAARRIAVPIFYIQDSEVSENDISGMNSVKKNWQLMDYINFYTTKGVNEFIQFSKICNKHQDIKPSTLLALCNPDGRRASKDVRNGYLEMMGVGQCETLLQMIKDFKPYTSLYKSTRFIEAIMHLYHNANDIGYEHSKMMQRVALYPALITPQIDKRSFIKMLQSIYNRNVKNDNVVQFLKGRDII